MSRKSTNLSIKTLQRKPLFSNYPNNFRKKSSFNHKKIANALKCHLHFRGKNYGIAKFGCICRSKMHH